MVGIVSYGAYIPFSRLSRKEIASAWGGRAAPGEKAVANFDEDSITMAVAAGLDCLKGFEREQIDGVFFATTTSPYKEKLSASVLAAALDLPRQVRVADFTDSLRAGTIALNSAWDAVNAGSLSRVLVVAADRRLGAPKGENEQLFGDGAAALLVGNSNVIASIEGSYSLCNEVMDVWRTADDVFVRSWEDRWVVSEGYEKTLIEAISGLMKRLNHSARDFTKVAVYGHDARSHAGLVRRLGFDPKAQVQDSLIDVVGHTGAAQVLMTLAGSLEAAKPGDKILLAGYGDGADAFVLRVAPDIEKVRDRRGVKGHLEPKRMLPNYQKYLLWRQLVPTEMGRRPPTVGTGAVALFRERKRVLALHGQKCKQCDTIQYHPTTRMRVCSVCKTKDQFEDVRLSDKKGQVFTFTLDNLGLGVEPPFYAIVDLEGGGRIFCEMTDVDPAEMKVGMPVELTFRKLLTYQGIHNYFWKSTPLR